MSQRNGESDAELTLAEQSDHKFPLLTITRRDGTDDLAWLVIAGVANFVKTFLSFADVFIIGLGIDALFNDRPLALPFVPQSAIPNDPMGLLVFITVLLIVFSVTNNFLSFVGDWGFNLFSQRLVHRTRVQCFDAIQGLELGFFEGERTGNLLSVLNEDTNQISSFYSVQIGAIIWIVATLVSALIYTWVLNPQLALLLILSAPVIAVMNYRFSDRLDPLQAAVREQRGALNARLETSLSNLRLIKAFRAETFEQSNVDEQSRADIDARLASVRESARHPPLNRLVLGGWLLGIASLGIYWVLVGPVGPLSGTLTAGQLVPFLFYLERLTLPMKNLGGVIGGYSASKAAANRVLGVVSDSAGNDEFAEQESGSQRLDVDDGTVIFDDVSYTSKMIT